MPSIGKNLNGNMSRDLDEFLSYILAGDYNFKPDEFTETLDRFADSALASGLPGIFELLATISSSLKSSTSVTENIKKDIIGLLQLTRQYLSQPDSAEIKNNLINSLSDSPLLKKLGDDQVSILASMLDMEIIPDNKNINTELDVSSDNYVSPDAHTEISKVSAKNIKYNREIMVNDSVQGDLRELLQIMQSELMQIDKSIRNISLQFSKDTSLIEISDDLGDCISSLDLFSEAVDTFDFKGLASVIRHIRNNVTFVENIGNEKKFTNSFTELQYLIDDLFNYLGNPASTQYINRILEQLRKPVWFALLTDTDIDEIARLLPVKIQTDQETHDDSPEVFTNEDVSLALPEDIDRDLLDALLHELPDQIEELANCISRFSNNGTLDDIQSAKRIAHTLKGAGNTVGIRGIAMITHKMEDILLSLYKNNVMPTENIQKVLERACDCLSAMSEYLLEIGNEPADSLEVLQQIAGLSLNIQKDGIHAGDAAAITSVAEMADSSPPDANLREEPKKSIKVPMAFMDQLLKLVGESITSNKQILSNLHETIELLKSNKIFYRELRFFGDKIEEVITTKDMYSGIDNKTGNYDDLEMDRFSDLHVYIQQLVEKTVDAEESAKYFLENLVNLDEKLIELGRINTEIKQNVENNRLVPVSSHSSRLQRIVRQASNLSEKKVELEIHGIDTLIDSDILNNLINSLIHLLRNAVDHGIENLEERINCGKNTTGKINLSFTADNNEIRIVCEDDGRGLDIDSIRKRATELGLLSKKDKVTDQEIEKLVFHPDFSTKTETTELSGRGIGLDAVHASVTELSGTINITTVPGKGTRFEIVLPSNRMIVNVLLVGMGSEIVSLSSRGIDQVFYHDQVKFHDGDSDDKYSVEINNSMYEAVTLESLLQVDYERRTSHRKSPLIVLYSKNRHEKLAVLVDRIHGCENMVLKGMGNYVPKIPGIMGISILGDGSITTVIDIVELVNIKPKYLPSGKRRFAAQKKLPTALVVDDSLSVRKSLTEFMENIGYNVRAAHDGLEAFEIASACHPTIIITDMEMPRMNGLELTSHIKSSTDMKDIPVIMITSRSAEKHMKEAADAGINAYITKPYSEEELLDTIKRLNINRE